MQLNTCEGYVAKNIDKDIKENTISFNYVNDVNVNLREKGVHGQYYETTYIPTYTYNIHTLHSK